VAYVGAHPILVTLATMTMVNGIGIYLSRGAAISGMPDIVRYIGADTLLGIPVPLIIFLVTAVLIAVFLERTRLGKYIYMSGSNINATHRSSFARICHYREIDTLITDHLDDEEFRQELAWSNVNVIEVAPLPLQKKTKKQP